MATVTVRTSNGTNEVKSFYRSTHFAVTPNLAGWGHKYAITHWQTGLALGKYEQVKQARFVIGLLEADRNVTWNFTTAAMGTPQNRKAAVAAFNYATVMIRQSKTA